MGKPQQCCNYKPRPLHVLLPVTFSDWHVGENNKYGMVTSQ